MLLLASTSDLLRVITGQAVNVDVHASWVDLAAGVVTPGRTNTKISTAATTTVVASPAGSTVRNIKTLIIENIHATSSVDVTVQHTDGTNVVQIEKVTLQAGESIQYNEDVGWTYFAASGIINGPAALAVGNANTGDVVANAANTYLTGSNFAIYGRIKAGTVFKWRLCATKTGAGVATPIFTIVCGTAGTTADTARVTFTLLAQTAVIDTGVWEIEAEVTTFSASGILAALLKADHNLVSTGFANAASPQVQQVSSSAFDLTVASSIVGLCCNPGASGVWTFKTVSLEMVNLLR